jgi:spore maturation protein CgeB
MRILFLGLSITSSWGNGHATTYRALVRALAARGHDVLFLERDAEWYAGNRDLPSPPYCEARLYKTTTELEDRFATDLRAADVVVVGSYVPDGIAVGDLVHRHATGVTAFYDIDTPVTLTRLRDGVDYLAPRQIPRYDVYLSFTGGPTLDVLKREHGARLARALYCSVDPDLYYPEPMEDGAAPHDLGYLGTYSDDRQPILDRLMLAAARRYPEGRFVVAGPQYPKAISWPANVSRVTHLSPALHRRFYNTLRFTLNITRRDMVAAGYSPSVRLFEAAACGTPIISDTWKGLDRFLMPGAEILLSRNARETMSYLRDIPEEDRREIGMRARTRVLGAHTAAHRAIEFEEAVAAAGLRSASSPAAAPVPPRSPLAETTR